MPKFSIIIVNYNSGIFLVELIDSFRSLNIAPDDFEFIIIDNASTDDSLTKVNWGTLQKKIIVNKQNVGFSRANNQGISLSQGRYVVLLNPDTKLLNNIFTIMENVLKEDRKIGICGPRIYYPDGRLQQSCFSFPSVTRKILAIIGLVDFIERNNFLLALLRRLRIIVPNSARVFETNFDNNFHASIDVPSISGACMMMEKGFLDKVGLLDENIFAYAEDEDLCLRARKLGYKIYYVPRANIVHQSGWKRSSGKTREVVDCKFKSSEYFYKKHYRGLKKYTLILLNKIDWGICRRKSVNSYFNMPCPICKRNSKPKFIEHYQIYKIYGCPLCKGQFSYPLDIDSSIYNELYSKDSTNDISYNSFISLPPERIVGLYKKCPTIKLALKLIKNPESNQKLLDIGCSQGAFCKLTEDLGFEVYGIDPSQDAVNYASSKLGIKNVIAGDLEDVTNSWKDFDIITLFEVIEHLSNPSSCISKSFRLLKPGGRLLISTPNNDRLELMLGHRIKADFPPHHLTRWRKKTFSILLNDLGFNKITIKVVPLYRVDIANIFAEGLLIKRIQLLGLPCVFKKREISRMAKLLLLSPLWHLAGFMGDLLALILNLFFPGKGSTLVVLAQKPPVAKV